MIDDRRRVMRVRTWLIHLYQIIRYGAVQKPLPDWSQSRHVRIINGYSSLQMATYDRQTGEITPSEGVQFAEYELRWLKEWGARTDKATLIIPKVGK